MRIPPYEASRSCTAETGTDSAGPISIIACAQESKPSIKFTAHPFFNFLSSIPREAQLFNQSMTDLSTIDGPAVADAYSFDGIRSIVDVGGGHGLLLATILARNPQMKGTLHEVAHDVAGEKDGPLKLMMERCTLATGDMFSAVPA